MMDALIGSTGFVGGNLLSQHTFAGRFHSRNAADMQHAQFNTVVCAAAPAAMWAANKDPKGDLQTIKTLLSHLSMLRTTRFVLISTIAVLAKSVGLDETTADFEETKAYGRNRRFLEQGVVDLFPQCHIVRLPALFGSGLKKNFIFDVLNPVPSFLTPDKYEELGQQLPSSVEALFRVVYSFNPEIGMYGCDRGLLVGENKTILTDALFSVCFTALNFTSAESTFQYYNLARLWSDTKIVLEKELKVMHLVPEPLRAEDVYQHLTGGSLSQGTAAPYHEDMRTQYAEYWQGRGHYIQSGASVLEDLSAFYNRTHS